MATKLTYALLKDREWGKPVWMLVAPSCSPFGRYPTRTLAEKDAQEYKLTYQRRSDMDNPSAGKKGY